MKQIIQICSFLILFAGAVVGSISYFATASDLKQVKQEQVQTIQQVLEQQKLDKKLTVQMILRNYRDDLNLRIKIAQEKGKDTTELEQKLHDVQVQLDAIAEDIK